MIPPGHTHATVTHCCPEKEPLVRRQASTNQTDLPCISLLCGSRTLAALLRKQQSGFFQGLRVKGLLWLRARLMTGNIERWLSSGIYHPTLLNVPVCSSVDGMWEIMCATRCVTASLIRGDLCFKNTAYQSLRFIVWIIYLFNFGQILTKFCVISASWSVWLWFASDSFWT